MSIVLSKAALALKNSDANFQHVKFESHKPKKKSAAPEYQTTDSKTSAETVTKKDLDLKKIRHEVVKFGMSGFDSTKKEEAKIALAVSLGAVPPKKKYLNYKELMQKRKEEKKKEAEDKQSMRAKSVLHSVGKAKNKNKNKKGPGNDVGHFLSGYGKVQKKDLKKKETGPPKKKKTLL